MEPYPNFKITTVNHKPLKLFVFHYSIDIHKLYPSNYWWCQPEAKWWWFMTRNLHSLIFCLQNCTLPEIMYLVVYPTSRNFYYSFFAYFPNETMLKWENCILKWHPWIWIFSWPAPKTSLDTLVWLCQKFQFGWQLSMSHKGVKWPKFGFFLICIHFPA